MTTRQYAQHNLYSANRPPNRKPTPSIDYEICTPKIVGTWRSLSLHTTHWYLIPASCLAGCIVDAPGKTIPRPAVGIWRRSWLLTPLPASLLLLLSNTLPGRTPVLQFSLRLSSLVRPQKPRQASQVSALQPFHTVYQRIPE